MTTAPAPDLRVPFELKALEATPIRTDRLRIRPIVASDADDIYAYQMLSDVVRYLPWPVRDRAESRTHTELRAATRVLSSDGDAMGLAIELLGEPSLGPAGDRVIGDLTLIVSSITNAQVAVGWVLHPQFQGRGLAAEAARSLLDLAVGLGAHRIVAVVDAANIGSAALCDRLGMRREGLMHEDRFADGSWRTTTTYAIRAAEWATHRAR